jgi:hypothetical protein
MEYRVCDVMDSADGSNDFEQLRRMECRVSDVMDCCHVWHELLAKHLMCLAIGDVVELHRVQERSDLSRPPTGDETWDVRQCLSVAIYDGYKFDVIVVQLSHEIEREICLREASGSLRRVVREICDLEVGRSHPLKVRSVPWISLQSWRRRESVCDRSACPEKIVIVKEREVAESQHQRKMILLYDAQSNR